MYHRWKTYSESDLNSDEREKMGRWGSEMGEIKGQPAKTKASHNRQVKKLLLTQRKTVNTRRRKIRGRLDFLFGV